MSKMDKQKKGKFLDSVAHEFITKAKRIPRPYTADDFKKEYFLPQPDELCKHR